MKKLKKPIDELQLKVYNTKCKGQEVLHNIHIKHTKHIVHSSHTKHTKHKGCIITGGTK